MFLDQKLSQIRDDKAKLGICCDLHRHMVNIEFQHLISGALQAVSNVALGFAVVEKIIRLLHDRKDNRR